MDSITQVYQATNGIGAIYIGSIENASDQRLLQYYNINYVLTVCIEQQIKLPQKINHKVLQWHDWKNFKISDYFDDALEFIENARMRGNLLIHCMAGISRSSTMMLAYLMKDLRIPLSKALDYLKRKRPQCRPNPGFIKQLLEYEQNLFGCLKSHLTQELTPFYKVQEQILYESPPPKKEKQKQVQSQKITPVKVPTTIKVASSALKNSPKPFGGRPFLHVKSQSGAMFNEAFRSVIQK